MEFGVVLAAYARRRGYVLLVLLIAALGVAYLYSTATVVSRSSTTLLVTAPTDSGSQVTGNPYLNLDSRVAQLASTVVTAMRSEAAANDLARSGASGSYTITNSSGGSTAPSAQVHITATAADSATVSQNITLIRGEAEKQLASLQKAAGVTASNQASISTLAAATTPERIRQVPVLYTVLGAVGVIVLGLILILVVEIRQSERRTRLRHRLTAPVPVTVGSD